MRSYDEKLPCEDRVRSCKDTKLQRYEVAKIRSCKYTKLQIYEVAKIRSCKDTKLQRYKVMMQFYLNFVTLQRNFAASLRVF